MQKALPRLIALVALLLVLVYYIHYRNTATVTPPAPEGNPLADRVVELERALAGLEARLAGLEKAGHLGATPTGVRQSIGEPDPTLLARAVERYLANRKPVTPKSAAATARYKALMADLLAPGTDLDRTEKVWRELRKAGLLDRALAHLKERAEREPDNPDAQFDLGLALLKKTETMVDGQEKGAMAIAGDKAFDRALKLDEDHWEARFYKATTLALWPPLFGKTPEAIRHYAILMDKQESLPVRPEQAQVYLLLGNIYNQQGNREKARATWQRGADRHPESGELRASLGR